MTFSIDTPDRSPRKHFRKAASFGGRCRDTAPFDVNIRRLQPAPESQSVSRSSHGTPAACSCSRNGLRQERARQSPQRHFRDQCPERQHADLQRSTGDGAMVSLSVPGELLAICAGNERRNAHDAPYQPVSYAGGLLNGPASLFTDSQFELCSAIWPSWSSTGSTDFNAMVSN